MLKFIVRLVAILCLPPLFAPIALASGDDRRDSSIIRPLTIPKSYCRNINTQFYADAAAAAAAGLYQRDESGNCFALDPDTSHAARVQSTTNQTSTFTASPNSSSIAPPGTTAGIPLAECVTRPPITHLSPCAAGYAGRIISTTSFHCSGSDLLVTTSHEEQCFLALRP